jgi:hypothetical protein
VTNALWYLTLRSLRNRLVSRFRRLRQPRYLIGAIAGALYFFLMFFSQAPTYRLVLSGQAEFVGSLFVCLTTVLTWATAKGLAFTRPEVQFLFSAPLTRRQLLQYKLSSGQVSALLSSAFLTVMFRRNAAAPMFFAGTWLMLMTINAHAAAVALARQSLGQHGWAGFVRQRMTLLVLATVFIAALVVIAPAWPRLVSANGPREVIDELQRLTTSGLGAVIFWPFKAVVRPVISASAWAFFRALPGALVLLGLNYLWVLRADTAFEEVSAERAEKVAKLMRAGPSGYIQPTVKKAGATPFPLATSGRPEMAIVWKNLIQLGRYATRTKLIVMTISLVLPIAGLAIAMRGEPIVDTAQFLTLFALGMTVFFGPQSVKNDFRRDLTNLAILKAWPMRGPALVRGEVMAAACVLTSVAWLVIVLGAVLSFGEARMITYAATGIILAPGVILLQVILQNMFVLLFPAWAMPPADPAAAMQGIGMRYVLMIVSIIALLLAAFPAALVAGLVGGGLYLMTHTIFIFLPAIAGSIVLIAECWLATELLGGRFERMDVSAIGPPA